MGLGGEVEAELVDDVAVVVVDDEGAADKGGGAGEEKGVELVVVEGVDGGGCVDLVPVAFGFGMGGFVLAGLKQELLGGIGTDGDVGRGAGEDGRTSGFLAVDCLAFFFGGELRQLRVGFPILRLEMLWDQLV